MGTGIMVCGLNGAGKSTLGKVLADRLGFYFIDNEYLFFSRASNDEPYTDPRSHEEVTRLLMDEVRKHPDFVFAAVKGDYGTEILPLYNYIILIEVPKHIRMQRIRNRSYGKFGERMLIGGDLYEQEERFFKLAGSRAEDLVEKWAQTQKCTILRIDGTKPVEENIAYIVNTINCKQINDAI